MTPEDKLHAELEARLHFETLIANLSSKFVNVHAGLVDNEIMDAERLICEFLDLDLVALWQWSVETPAILTTHVYARSAAPGQMRPGAFPLVFAGNAGRPHGCRFFAGGVAGGGRR